MITSSSVLSELPFAQKLLEKAVRPVEIDDSIEEIGRTMAAHRLGQVERRLAGFQAMAGSLVDTGTESLARVVARSSRCALEAELQAAEASVRYFSALIAEAEAVRRNAVYHTRRSGLLVMGERVRYAVSNTLAHAGFESEGTVAGRAVEPGEARPCRDLAELFKAHSITPLHAFKLTCPTASSNKRESAGTHVLVPASQAPGFALCGLSGRPPPSLFSRFYADRLPAAPASQAQTINLALENSPRHLQAQPPAELIPSLPEGLSVIGVVNSHTQGPEWIVIVMKLPKPAAPSPAEEAAARQKAAQHRAVIEAHNHYTRAMAAGNAEDHRAADQAFKSKKSLLGEAIARAEGELAAERQRTRTLKAEGRKGGGRD